MKIGPLNPSQVGRTLVDRLAGTPERPGPIDRARQIATRLGARPYRVFLVWTRFGGEEHGEGDERELDRLEILPTPKVGDLTSVAMNPYSAGKLPVGSVSVREISAGRHTEDLLRGRVTPKGIELRPSDDFFWEVVEDGRGDPKPERKRFRLFAGPTRSATTVEFQVVLERASEDRTRAGKSKGPGDRGRRP